jgi:hypothetical protein
MNADQPSATPKKMLWAGYILSTLAALFMLMDGVMKLSLLTSAATEFELPGWFH